MKPTRMGMVTVMLIAGVMATPLLARATAGTKERGSPQVVVLKDSRLKFEINDTDGDGGVQAFIDADCWRWISIFDPNGRKIFSASTSGIMAEQGGTELFLESAEPPFTELPLSELLERFPEGEYRFSGRGINGETFVGSASLTHNIPAGPELVSPIEGDAPQDPVNTVVKWEPVAPPNGSPILGYQVLVVQPGTGITALPKLVLDVMMPASATSMEVPAGFLQPGTEYEWEVLAVEASGNQTLSSSSFTTSK